MKGGCVVGLEDEGDIRICAVHISVGMIREVRKDFWYYSALPGEFEEGFHGHEGIALLHQENISQRSGPL